MKKIFLIPFITSWFFISISASSSLEASAPDFFEEPDPIISKNLKRLVTPDQHIEALENAFLQAKKSVLVTNYGNLYRSILKTKLFQEVIPNARQRGVKVYVRYMGSVSSQYDAIPDDVQYYFDQLGVDVAPMTTHAKIVAVDDGNITMMGSYNWLTDLTSHYPNLNHSFVYTGPQGYQMKEHIWKTIKYYRNKDFSEGHNSNFKSAYRFRRSPSNESFILYDSLNNPILTYVALIEKHRMELLRIFEKAKHRIIILSPFVSRQGTETYQRDFVHDLLSHTLERGVEVCFVCLPEHKERFDDYMEPFLNRYPSFLKVIPQENLHAKTLIQDDSLIAEGSFNWLCAARDEVYETHKHEATLIYEGKGAKNFVKDFYATDLGKNIEQIYTKEKKENLIKRRRNIKKRSFFSQRSYFLKRRKEIKRDMWSRHPLWVKHSPEYHYLRYGKYIEVMSGRPFKRRGYCIRMNKRIYIKDESERIRYFPDLIKAKEETYDQKDF